MKLFLVYHFYVNRLECGQYKRIGVFKDIRTANEVIEDLSLKAGFKDYQTGFNIVEVEVDKVLI
jgi:hypothetical protein